MLSTRQKTVLISEPGCREVQSFLPYLWAILKSYHERHGDTARAVQWLPPIHGHSDADSLLAPYDAPIDVLGLSCYMWNWDLQGRIAQAVKSHNPGCLVVAGGPQPDYKDPLFFKKHPYIDMVVVKDGEIPFSKILTTIVNGGRDFTHIAGLYLPSASDNGHLHTGPTEIVTTFDYSPYIDQSAYFEATFRPANHGDFQYHAVWETNRGCPYSCSYCDWGSATMSKIRRFDMARIEAEVEWLAWMRLHVLFLADANFGILPRDVEIADMITSNYAKSGYPRYLAYSSAKNNPERSVAISRKFFVAGITGKHELSIQHTRKEVLAATDRANISSDKQVAVVKELMAEGVPIDVQLIRGIPGDTYELSKLCLADLMEMGIHETYTIYPYQLLPNAPAADSAYLEEWKVGTITRYSFVTTDGKRSPDDIRLATRNRIIVESKTFSRADWVSMNSYAALAQALHNAGVTRLISMYLRLTHGVAYHEFYQRVIEDFCARTEPAASFYRALVRHYQGYLVNDEAIDYMKVEELPGYPLLLQPSRWALVQICRHLPEFFDGLKRFLCGRYPSIPNLESVIEYQENLVILPTYDREQGKRFLTDCDWVGYFAQVRGAGGSPLAEPESTSNAVVEVTDRTCTDEQAATHQLDWSGSDEERWVTWIERTIVGDTSSSARRNNFQQLQFRRGIPQDVGSGTEPPPVGCVR